MNIPLESCNDVLCRHFLCDTTVQAQCESVWVISVSLMEPVAV